MLGTDMFSVFEMYKSPCLGISPKDNVAAATTVTSVGTALGEGWSVAARRTGNRGRAISHCPGEMTPSTAPQRPTTQRDERFTKTDRVISPFSIRGAAPSSRAFTLTVVTFARG